ncbi:MAG: alpha/beta fold hydrolase [Deltaproteobacteria bacterium]|nr:alpha/beta fold hydrolase [Deltaproteobacteria bacterium]
MGKHFVLIHGAWHGGWCWDGVIKELEKQGHTAQAPTMPGHNPGDDRSGITFDDYVDKISSVLAKQDSPVVLAGHSSAGSLLQMAAPKTPVIIQQLIFHNAFILPDGKCQFDLVPPEASEGMTAAANASPDNCVPVIEDFVRHQLMAGESTEVQDALISRLVPQPMALFTTPVNTAEFEKLTIPKTVLFCKDDASLPPGAYLGMAQGLGDFKLVEVSGCHESIFTNPAVVAEGLMRAVA